jgi:hypothetical protein
MTTGLFPHEIVLQCLRPAQITRITTITGKVRNMLVSAAMDKDLTDWNEIDATTSLPELQTHQLNDQRPSYAIKLVISQGWGSFAALYLIRVEEPTFRGQHLV